MALQGQGLPAWLLRGTRVLLDTVLPPLCPGCGGELLGTRWICGSCRRAFRPVPAGELCLLCRGETRPRAGRDAGLGCPIPGHRPFLGAAAYWMEPPLDAVVHAFKYAGREDLARSLGRLLADRIASRMPADGEWAGVSAIPLHPARRRERGYDQAELLGRAMATAWGIPYVPGLLSRVRQTRPQARLPEGARRGNLVGAFRVVEPGWVIGRSWVLVDDVVTTGSTLWTAVEALRATGAARVAPLALALA